MKFLICSSFAPSLINFRGRFLEELRALDFEVVAIAPEFDPEVIEWCMERSIVMETIDLKSQGLNPIGDLKTIYNLYKIIKRHKPQYSMGYTHKAALYTAYASALCGIPNRMLMVTGLGYGFEPGRSRFSWLISFITFQMFRVGSFCSHKMIFHNEDNRQFFLKRKITLRKSKTVTVGGSGVNLMHYPYIELKNDVPEKLTFLLVARLVRYKGIYEYAQAAEKLAQEFPSATFRLIGYRDQSPIGYTEQEFNFISDQVEIMGKRNDISQQLANCDVYVLPSYGEGLPRTVLEAMATGRAVVTTDTYGCRSTIDKGRNGILVKVRDMQSLYEGMRKFLTGELNHQQMGRESRQIVEEKFDVNTVNAQMLDAMGILKTKLPAESKADD